MKASEVLQKYAAGERNFRGLNLSCQYFHSKDLSGADFSKADIRGTNFTQANLKAAKFCNAKAGFPTFWLVALFIVSLLLALITIALSALITWLLLLTGGNLLAITFYPVVALIAPLLSLAFFGRFHWKWVFIGLSLIHI